MTNPNWRQHAACAGTNPDNWDVNFNPANGLSPRRIEQEISRGTACLNCPVIRDCAQAALEDKDCGVIRAAVPLCVTPSRKWHQREKRTLKAIADGAGPATALAKLYKSHMMAARRQETIRAQQQEAA